MSLNVVALVGRLTRDPELKYTASNTAVCSFTVAVERSYKSESGERQSDFINCSAWRQTAEFICKYFQKGSLIALNGELQTRKYTDKDGVNRTSTEVQVNNVSFCDSKKGSDAAQVAQNEQPAPIPAQPVYAPSAAPAAMQQPVYQQPPTQPQPLPYQHPISAQNPVPVQPMQPVQPMPAQQPAQPYPFPGAAAQPVQPSDDLPF